MKKNILLLGKKICFFTLLLLGVGAELFGAEKLLYGDKVYIKNLKIKKYATRDGNILVGHKAPSDKSVFVIAKYVDTPELGIGTTVKYGDRIYLQTSPAAVIGDSGETYRIYGMKRKLLGTVPTVSKNKIYEFTILPSTGKKAGQPVYYGEKINLQYTISTSESPIKYFRFNVNLSTYKKGTEVFGSDDSKLMTKTQIKETKELAFEKVQGVSAAKSDEEKKKLTYYDVLGIDKNADSKSIVKKCRQILLKIHPDKVASEEKKIAGEASQVINAAKEVLSNNKSTYDEWLKWGGSVPAGINVIKITPEIYEFIKEKTK